MDNTSILALRCRAVQPLRVGEVPSIRSSGRAGSALLLGERERGAPLNLVVSRQKHVMAARLALIIFLITLPHAAMAIDLTSLWDFGKPDLSEQRFRAALAGASADDALILQTQIARTYGLRRDFTKSQEILKGLEPQMSTASAEARARYSLELGRSYASVTHPPDTQTADARERARRAYMQAFELAKVEKLDELAVDALHMLAFVDTAPADQLKWAQEALVVVEGSSQPSAKRWEASLHNNIGYALHQLGRFDDALTEFKKALVLRERGTNVEATRIAHWMVAWTLRALNRTDEALEIQLRLERERDTAGVPSPYVFEELEHLYRAKGDEARSRQYAERAKALPK